MGALTLTFAAPATHAQADANERAIRRLVLRDARARWAECSREADDDRGGTRIAELVVLGPGHALAQVETACHRIGEGGGNSAGSVVLVENRRVSLVSFAPRPAWAPAHRACGEDENTADFVWNASLAREGDDVILTTFPNRSGMPIESGCHTRYAWRGGRFEMVEVRHRDGGDAELEADVGPFPIVGPPERACRPVLSVVDAAARRARLTAIRGASRASTDFTLTNEGECTGTSDTLSCGRGQSPPPASYTVVSREEDWVVFRVADGQDEEEVARIRRGCAL